MEHILCHENLECLFSQSRNQLHFLVAQGASAAPLFQKNISGQRLHILSGLPSRRFFLQDNLVLKHPSVPPILQKNSLTDFVPSYCSSPFLERWAKTQQIRLLSPSWKMQHWLEDKISFHQLLLEHGLPVPAGKILASLDDFAALPSKAWVLQNRHSEGMDGTFLIESLQELSDLMMAQQWRFPLLCREYLKGFVYGISIVVGKQDLMVSALRIQCRDLRERNQTCQAIQWIPAAGLTPSLRSKITATMLALGQTLQQVGFLGIANIDFIVSDNDVFIIECNPRFSAATPQVALRPELLHGHDLIQAYLAALLGQRLPSTKTQLPQSHFAGCYIDFSAFLISTHKPIRKVLQAILKPGIYRYAPNRIGFVSDDLDEMSHQQDFLFHYSSPVGTKTNAKSDFGSVFTNFRCFDIKGHQALLNPTGYSLLQHLAAQVQFKAPKTNLKKPVGLEPVPPA